MGLCRLFAFYSLTDPSMLPAAKKTSEKGCGKLFYFMNLSIAAFIFWMDA